MSEPERVEGPDGERWYAASGAKYPSVTTALEALEGKKQAIAGWRAKLRREGRDPDRVRDEKATLGTLVHHRVLNPYAMRPLPMPEIDMDLVYDGIQTDIELCEGMWNQLDFDVGQSPYVEKRVAVHDPGYAGTFDLLTNGPDVPNLVCDLKTSKQVFESHRLQAAAYYHAVDVLNEYPDPDGAAIIVLHPDAESNPELTAHVERLKPSQLGNLYQKFEMVLSKYKQEAQSI